MSETAQSVAEDVVSGEIECEELYRIPASEVWPWGDEVGFVKADGWKIAVNWTESGDIRMGQFAIDPVNRYEFPAATEWMITDNDAIDYGLEQ